MNIKTSFQLIRVRNRYKIIVVKIRIYISPRRTAYVMINDVKKHEVAGFCKSDVVCKTIYCIFLLYMCIYIINIINDR